jgi:hypothetical protein
MFPISERFVLFSERHRPYPCILFVHCTPLWQILSPSLGQTLSKRNPAAGFWGGLWHGIIAPITFIVSLFATGVSIYEQ